MIGFDGTKQECQESWVLKPVSDVSCRWIYDAYRAPRLFVVLRLSPPQPLLVPLLCRMNLPAVAIIVDFYSVIVRFSFIVSVLAISILDTCAGFVSVLALSVLIDRYPAQATRT